VVGACALALIPASRAFAAPDQALVMEDEHRLLEGSQADQAAALDAMSQLGADKIRVVAWWRFLAAGANRSRPPRGNPADLSSPAYQAARVAMLDSLVRGAHARGIAVILDPAAASGLAGSLLHLPRWAVRDGAAPAVPLFAKFVKALARRYGGAYTPAGQHRRLPAVHEWSVWNEPNNHGFLTPQWKSVDGQMVPWSPVLYRRLYRASARALRRNGHGADRIYFGETAATGLQLGSPLTSIAPGRFVRELACVDADLQPFTGAAARRRDCTGYAPLDTNGLATHFYSAADGSAPAVRLDLDPDDWTPRSPERPAALLSGLAAAGRLPPGLRVYNTEAGFQSNNLRSPVLGLGGQASSTNIAEYLQWREPSVASFSRYLLYDDPNWTSGLRRMSGEAKPAFAAFRMPLVVRDRGNGTVEVWGASYGRTPGRPTAITANGLPAALVRPADPNGYFDLVLPGNLTTAFQATDVLSLSSSRVALPTPGL